MPLLTWPFDPPPGGFDPSNDYGPRVGSAIVSSNHMGVDFGKNGGTPIPSAGDGVVVVAGVWRSFTGYGNAVIVDHGFGLFTLYGHCRRIYVEVGQVVKHREDLGEVGTTGNSTGNHLHLGTMVGSITRFVDPVEFFAEYGTDSAALAGLTPEAIKQIRKAAEMYLVKSKQSNRVGLVTEKSGRSFAGADFSFEANKDAFDILEVETDDVLDTLINEANERGRQATSDLVVAIDNYFTTKDFPVSSNIGEMRDNVRKITKKTGAESVTL